MDNKHTIPAVMVQVEDEMGIPHIVPMCPGCKDPKCEVEFKEAKEKGRLA